MQEYTKAQNKGLEEDLPSKWRTKKKKAGVAILLTDKIDSKATKIKRDKKTLHNGKMIDTTRRASDPKNKWTQHRSTR